MRMKRRAESLKPVSVVTEAAAVVVDQPIGEPDAPSSWTFFYLLTERFSLQTNEQTKPKCFKNDTKQVKRSTLSVKKKSGVFHHFKGTMARFVMGRSKLLQSGSSAWGGGFSASHTISRASGAIFTRTLKRLLLRMVITVEGEISCRWIFR